MNNRSTYYSSHSKLPFIGEAGNEKLQQSNVLVIGAGGLGCPCLIALAGAGVGTIGIADFDTISVSNLHRQQLYSMNEVGQLKTTVAAEKLKQYNPFIKINVHHLLVDENNILELISAYKIIVDCTDNFSTRYLINDACVYLDKPFVYGAIHQSEGHVTVFNYQHSPTLRCLFPKDDTQSIASCAEIGAYNISTAIIGNMMANEVIKILLQNPGVLAGKLKQVNVLEGSILSISYKAVEESRQISQKRFEEKKNTTIISPSELAAIIKTKNNFLLVDVREPDEHECSNIGGINIPLKALLQQNNFPFTANDEIILYCEKGMRSDQAVGYLQQKGFPFAKSLQGGINLFFKLSAQ